MQPWVIFLVVSWGFVLSLTGWAFWRLMSDEGKKHFDPDGIGPASPPVKGHAEGKKNKK